MKSTRRRLTSIVSALAFGLTPFAAPAQDDYPNRVIRLVVPFPPGGTSDAVARALAAGMRDRLGQTVVVENRGGGGTVTGTDVVAKSAPDGYTLLWATAPLAINATLFPQLPYDTFKDFVPVVNVASTPLVMIVNPASPSKTVQELIAAAKKSPGKLSYGSSGNGGSPHLSMEMFKAATGTRIVHVPYRGSAPAVMDLIGGQTDVVIDTLFLTMQQVSAGKARALAQTGATRSALLPDVPTLREAGLTGYEATSWFALVAPAKTPPAILAKLNAAANESLKVPAVRDQFAKQGVDMHGGSLEEAARFLRSEVERWGAAVKSSGAKPD